MPSLGPLQRLRDLNRSSRDFPTQLADTLLMEGCIDQVQNLQDDDLEELVEDLDHVCAQFIFICPLLS